MLIVLVYFQTKIGVNRNPAKMVERVKIEGKSTSANAQFLIRENTVKPVSQTIISIGGIFALITSTMRNVV